MLKTWSKDPELRPCFAQICTELQLCIANRRYISHSSNKENMEHQLNSAQPISQDRPISQDSGFDKSENVEDYLTPVALQDYLLSLPSKAPHAYDLNLK